MSKATCTKGSAAELATKVAISYRHPQCLFAKIYNQAWYIGSMTEICETPSIFRTFGRSMWSIDRFGQGHTHSEWCDQHRWTRRSTSWSTAKRA